MGDFSGNDFNEIGFEDAKKYCAEVFAKLVKDSTLLDDNGLEKNATTYIFKTKLSKEISAMNEDLAYEVEFNKKTKEVSVIATSFTNTSKGLTGQELDNAAKEIISKFKDSTFKKYKKVNLENASKIRNIEYSYIEEINGIYDEMKKIEIHLEREGLISRFKIRYPYDEKVIAPIISKEDILKKLEKGSEVIDVLTIRNIEGETEYEVHIKYKNTVYAAIFDGQTSELKYYGTEIRNYK